MSSNGQSQDGLRCLAMLVCAASVHGSDGKVTLIHPMLSMELPAYPAEVPGFSVFFQYSGCDGGAIATLAVNELTHGAVLRPIVSCAVPLAPDLGAAGNRVAFEVPGFEIAGPGQLIFSISSGDRLIHSRTLHVL